MNRFINALTAFIIAALIVSQVDPLDGPLVNNHLGLLIAVLSCFAVIFYNLLGPIVRFNSSQINDY